ncbi:MAG: histidine kinase [Rubrivivax sp.]|nr:histidine kinase [Rubrivivax sp.]
MNAPSSGQPAPRTWSARWQRFSATALRAFHAYGAWLVSITWKRFIVLAFGLIVLVAIVHDIPPFTWKFTERIEPSVRIVTKPVLPPRPPRAPRAPEAAEAPSPGVHIELPNDVEKEGVDISIGKDGVRITPKGERAARAASAAAQAAEQAAHAAEAAASAAAGLHISVPPGPMAEIVREALAEARREMQDAVRQARQDAEEAARDAEQARREAQQAIDTLTEDIRGPTERTTRVGIGDFLMQFTLLWVFASAILKYTYKGRIQAEVKAAQATETAEAESLKRQVVEARMAAMQAQVEPHFLFNTLASIDHLIETDPARASQMQKNLIALLRASMPTMREANGDGSNGVRDLGRELAVIRPYLEILKVRMEERLSTDIQVPDGLLSAEFPPMMVQTLVENAIKHGLEPKAEGGSLKLKAEIVHGKLQVTVADTGLGFGKAATAGTGVGLANIRERLQLLYGPRATLTVTENQPSGTVVTITVPYKTVEGTPA